MRGRPVRLNIRGRSVLLYGLRRPLPGVLGWVLVLGPGLIAAAAGNDAGGIATYSQAGARFGYDLLWLLVPITAALMVIQETCARLGAATGRGLLDLVREEFGLGWACFALGVVLVANTGLVVSEFLGIGAAAELLGVPRAVAVPLAAGLTWYLVVYGNYRAVEKVLIVMTLAFLAYPVSAFLAGPDWVAAGKGLIVPQVRFDPEFLGMAIALLGTTITPYMQLFQQSSVVDKGVTRSRYGSEKADAYLGTVASNIISAFIIVATAATLHAAGTGGVETAADAAEALRPLAGDLAGVIFGVGLLGASALAAAVLPLATGYALTETFGLPRGVDLDFRRAPAFLGVFTGLIGFGALVALIPGLPVVDVLIRLQVLNGVLLPFILFFVMRLAGNPKRMGALRNGAVQNMVGWASLVGITAAAAVYLVSQAPG